MSNMNEKKEKKSLGFRFMDFVEKAGNKLPHPFIMFLEITLGIIVISVIAAMLGLEAKHPAKDEIVVAKSLLSADGLRYMVLNLIKNFTGFAPLGLVLTMMLGIGLAEKTGLMSAFMKRFIQGAPTKLLVAAIFLIGICGNLASDAAVIIVPPLAGVIFYAAKKNPLVGIAAGYAAACAGFTANLMIAGTDALLAGITQEAAKIIDPAMSVNPTVNYFFMVVSTLLLTATGVWVTGIVEKKVGPYEPKGNIFIDESEFEVTDIQKKGLKSAGIVTLVYFLFIIAIMIPQSSPFRGPEGTIIPSPFLSGIVTFILFWFVFVGLAYGIKVGVIKTSADVPRLMTEAISEMSGYIVLVFIIAQFVAYFNWTNLGLILAVSLGSLLNAWNFTGLPMVILVILFTMFVNLFIGSGSAKWALLAPVFVPMFMMVGYSPAFAQLAYRIGDSTTNSITPLFPYFPILLGFMQKYEPKIGIGTVMAMSIPYSLAFGIVWIIQLIVWVLLNLPIGPGATIFM